MTSAEVAAWLRPRRVLLWPPYARGEYNRWAAKHYQLDADTIEAAHRVQREDLWWLAQAFCAAMQTLGLRPEDLTRDLLGAVEPILHDLRLPNTFRLIGPWRDLAEYILRRWEAERDS